MYRNTGSSLIPVNPRSCALLWEPGALVSSPGRASEQALHHTVDHNSACPVSGFLQVEACLYYSHTMKAQQITHLHAVLNHLPKGLLLNSNVHRSMYFICFTNEQREAW